MKIQFTIDLAPDEDLEERVEDTLRSLIREVVEEVLDQHRQMELIKQLENDSY